MFRDIISIEMDLSESGMNQRSQFKGNCSLLFKLIGVVKVAKLGIGLGQRRSILLCLLLLPSSFIQRTSNSRF
jgi:hypothetical protein